jgi:putative transposase
LANTYHQLYVQSVFAVKYRASVLEPTWRSEFFGVVGNLINETGCTNIIVNGVEDHIHCFFGLIPSLSIAEVMQKVKSNSSGWLNKRNYVKHRFEWQSGYGSFSYSRSHINNVFRYIQNQEAHHKKQSFRKEYINMLNRFGVKYDERYIFDDLI